MIEEMTLRGVKSKEPVLERQELSNDSLFEKGEIPGPSELTAGESLQAQDS